MSLFLKTRWFLFAVLIIFVACKIPHLYYPYYWDESWPYAPALKAIYLHGPSLMPNAIDSELSRGHPLLFHALAATWMNVFGTSHISLHSFALLISVMFLIFIYETALNMFGLRAAILTLLLIVVQEIFFIQSSTVMLEMLMAFLCFLSIVFYAKQRYLLTALCITMLFYTKESGLVLGLVLGVDALVGIFDNQTALKLRIYRLLSVCVPFLLIGIFFLVQKHIRGWYAYPLHAAMIQHRWDIIWYTLRMSCIETLFCGQQRSYYFLLLVALAVFTAALQKKTKWLVALLPTICIYYFVDDTRAGRLLPSVPFFIVFIISSAFFIYTYSAREFYEDPKQRKLIRLSSLFVFCFLCFSAMNFFTPRYILAAMVPMLFIISVFFINLIEQSRTWLYYPIVACVLIIGGFAYARSTTSGDCEHGIFDGLDVQQGVVNYFEKNVGYDQNISAFFLEGQHLSNPATGFLHTEKYFRNVKWEVDKNTQYVVFDNIENDARYFDFKKDTNFYLAQKIEKNKVWAEIYKRRLSH